ncbi:Gfo/Idh/MocA family oxidoreductase [Hydrogenovibrio thermophilus]|uniref:Homoserine dehydrogenase n=1 Tax=Hydrogenovibrio thermophilus TaxID=265883 RepID=A0A410H3I3_9GAMM|nr:homoserine dehydrogenase [Hydrogenovibrio thermophilus]QAB15488.1 homoserine dehydrogenase [Hydrogenovibrio thermophilus]
MRKITILMIGLGRIGGKFYEQFSEMNPEQVEIIAISEPNFENPLVDDAEKRGIPNYPQFEEAIERFGEGIDIIMDTSNRPELKQAIRQKLVDSGNQHSVVVPMVVDYLMWYLLPGAEAIPQSHHKNIGY